MGNMNLSGSGDLYLFSPIIFQVGYDDVAMIRYKSEYIRKMGLGGGMVWALDLDDFKNRCGQGHHPLMNTIKA